MSGLPPLTLHVNDADSIVHRLWIRRRFMLHSCRPYQTAYPNNDELISFRNFTLFIRCLLLVDRLFSAFQISKRDRYVSLNNMKGREIYERMSAKVYLLQGPQLPVPTLYIRSTPFGILCRPNSFLCIIYWSTPSHYAGRTRDHRNLWRQRSWIAGTMDEPTRKSVKLLAYYCNPCHTDR